MIQKNNYVSLLSKNQRIACGVTVLYLLCCLSILFLVKHTWADENHFYHTACLFAQDISLENLKHYDELISPLSFLLYGIWGKLFGTALITIRCFSLIVALITHLSMFNLLNKLFNGSIIWWLWGIWLANPYNVGLSVFIFTDMLSNLFIILFIHAFINKKYIILGILSALLVYTRQYNAVLIFALGIYAFVCYFFEKKKEYLLILISLIAGTASFIPLYIFWNGIVPQSEMSKGLQGFRYNFNASMITTYVMCIFVYTLPVSVFLIGKSFKKNMLFVVTAAVFLCVYYYFFPVRASAISIKDGIYTVGFFHKLILTTIAQNNNAICHFILYVFFVCGFFLLSLFIGKTPKNYLYNFCLLYIILFIVMMSFSFQVWEKYATQALPAALICIGYSYSKKRSP